MNPEVDRIPVVAKSGVGITGDGELDAGELPDPSED